MSSEFGTGDTVNSLGGRLREMIAYESLNRVRTDPGKPGKFWNFVMAFSRTGKSLKRATRPGKFKKSVKLNQKI